MRYSFAMLALSGLSAAAPLELRKDTVSPAVFDNLELFSQYAAAAYCKGNNDTPNTKITCSEKNCNRVEKAKTNTLTEFENSSKTDATGFVATDDTNSLIVVSFRGSKSELNWQANADILMESFSACSGCKVHSGFNSAWKESQDAVTKAVASAQAKWPKYKVVVTGHSLGGAMATLAAAYFRGKGIYADLYTYGAPKVGNDKVSSFMGKTDKGQSYRVVHKDDLVPTLPPSIPILAPYASMGYEYYIKSATTIMPKLADVEIFKAGEDDKNPASSAEAHRWYFGPISTCANDDKKPKM